MAQRVFWNWKDDDLTVDLVRWFNGIHERGRYRGFDDGGYSGLELILNHNISGMIRVDKDLVTSAISGLLITPQGSIVQEDAPVHLNISAGDSQDRIDLVVFQHSYVVTPGGQPGVYVVYQGNPSVAPVAPNPTNPATDCVIGEIYVPALSTDLSTSVWTQAESPSYAAGNWAHRNRVNEFTKLNAEASPSYTSTFDADSQILTVDKSSNTFVLPNTVTVSNPIAYILLPGVVIGTKLKLVATYSDISLEHVFGGGPTFIIPNENTPLLIIQGGWVEVIYTGSLWEVVDYTINSVWSRNNVFKKAQQYAPSNNCRIIQKSYTITGTTYNRFILDFDPDSNMFVFDLGAIINKGFIFDINTDVLSLYISEPIKYKYPVDGIDIYIKFIGGGVGDNLRFAQPAIAEPFVGFGTGFIPISQTDEIKSYSDAVGTISFNIKAGDVIRLKSINTGFELNCDSITARKIGGNLYEDTTNIVSNNDSLETAISKLSAFNKKGFTFGSSSMTNVTGSGGIVIPTLLSGSQYISGVIIQAYATRIGDMVTLSGNITGTMGGSGSSYYFFIQDLPSQFLPKAQPGATNYVGVLTGKGDDVNVSGSILSYNFVGQILISSGGIIKIEFIGATPGSTIGAKIYSTFKCTYKALN